MYDEAYEMKYRAQCIEVNKALLLRLKFNEKEINDFEKIVKDFESKMYNLKRSPTMTKNSVMQVYRMNYVSADRFMYMYKICQGSIRINNKEEIAKHFKKLNGSLYRIGITDLAISTLTQVPRLCFITGIRDNTFSVYNSSNYTGMNRLFLVNSVSSVNTCITTKIKPVLKYGQSKEVPDVIKIDSYSKETGKLEITVNNKYCALCNRYIIVASLRRPEFHLGLCEMICFEGTTIYIYAKDIGHSKNAKYSNSTERVYDYGINIKEAKGRIAKVTDIMKKKLRGVWLNYEPANSDFHIITPKQEENEFEGDEVNV